MFVRYDFQKEKEIVPPKEDSGGDMNMVAGENDDIVLLEHYKRRKDDMEGKQGDKGHVIESDSSDVTTDKSGSLKTVEARSDDQTRHSK
ncbi:hypothetical protein OROGR_015142 [Orobanche gracilis]